MACGPRLSVKFAAPTATTRLVGQFWGLDSDRVFEFSSDRSYSPKRLTCSHAAAAFKNSSCLTGSSISASFCDRLEVYQHLSLESFDKAYQDAVQTRRASDAGHPQSVTFLWDITYLCWNLTSFP